jgi:hypothetical protein
MLMGQPRGEGQFSTIGAGSVCPGRGTRRSLQGAIFDHSIMLQFSLKPQTDFDFLRSMHPMVGNDRRLKPTTKIEHLLHTLGARFPKKHKPYN